MEIWVLTRLSEHLTFTRRQPSRAWLDSRKRLMLAQLHAAIDNSGSLVAGWLVSVGPNTPQDFCDELASDIAPIGKVVRQIGRDHSAVTFSRFLPAGRAKITIRVDSDDLVSENFFSSIAEMKMVPGQLVSFARGTLFDQQGLRTARSVVESNALQAFCSLTENVFSLGHHGTAPSHGGVAFVSVRTEEPMWMVSLGTGNAVNQFPKTYFPESRKLFRESFPNVTLDVSLSGWFGEARAKLRFIAVAIVASALGIINNNWRSAASSQRIIIGSLFAASRDPNLAHCPGRKRRVLD